MEYTKLILQKALNHEFLTHDEVFSNDPDSLIKFQRVYAEANEMYRDRFIEVCIPHTQPTEKQYVDTVALRGLTASGHRLLDTL